MHTISFHKRKKIIRGTVQLTPSKSESSRVMVIRALLGNFRKVKSLSTADDTYTLWKILQLESLRAMKRKKEEVFTHDIGAGGTTMRFLTAYFAIQPGIRILKGTARMKERPISILVDALRKLGAKIEYLEKEGYPPLKIDGNQVRKNEVAIDGSVSSQYISALLLIAPVLPQGLKIKLTGKVASWPYIDMTMKIMEHFGAKIHFDKNVIEVRPGGYRKSQYKVEADWSSASYWYEIAALSDNAIIRIPGLKKNSLQGDAVVAEIFKRWGVKTSFTKTGIKLSKTKSKAPGSFSYNFTDCPDIAQTLAVTGAFTGVKTKLSGLKSLKIKETDRINAVKKELEKFGVNVVVNKDELSIQGLIKTRGMTEIETYQDHRMAMAFAPTAMAGEKIRIRDHSVINKSYPSFWQDLEKVGFTIR